MIHSATFLVFTATALLAMIGAGVASSVIGLQRRREGLQFSNEIEQAAGMQERWRPGAKTAATPAGDGDQKHAAA